ncbi:MAG: ABC transporter substrate-binding protein [Actinobacteria bacterium]|nr:ABC transporter substrate-binding protein [Actinomycetota bacterium]
MRTHFRSGALGAIILSLALVATGCGGSGEDTTSEPTTADGTTRSEPGGPADGPTITVASFNFPESVILAEIYAQALEHRGYPIEKKLDLGSRELILPELKSGAIDLLPEYVGSALGVGFGGEPTADTQETAEKLQAAYESEDYGVTVLEPAPGQDKNVFVVTESFAQEHGVQTISDLANVDGTITFGGPPECENRDTCLQGLQDVYGLENVEFQPIQEGSARVASLENGDIDLSLLFSTQPVIDEKGFVALEDDEGMIPAENVVPVVTTEVVDAYGDDFTSLLNEISAMIETQTLLDLNGQVELEAKDPAVVAEQWLQDNGFLD